MIPRTSVAGLGSTNPDIHREIIDESRMLRNQDPNEEFNSELLSGSEKPWGL